MHADTEFAIRADEMARIGKVVKSPPSGGKPRWRIYFGKQHGYLYAWPDTFGERVPFETADEAQRALARCHAYLEADYSLVELLSRVRRKQSAETKLGYHIDRWLAEFAEMESRGQRSAATLREYERIARTHFTELRELSVYAFGRAEAARWQRNLAAGLLAKKTQKNAQTTLKSFLHWLVRSGVIDEVPAFDEIRKGDRIPQLLKLDELNAVLAAIDWPRRGGFLAGAWMLMRPREIQAAVLTDYSSERIGNDIVGTLRRDKAVQGDTLSAPIRGRKSGTVQASEVWHDELLEWLEWRSMTSTSEERIAGKALFNNPAARNQSGRWTAWPQGECWKQACRKAGVKVVPLREGTKHSGATIIAPHISPYVLKELGGWQTLDSALPYARPKATRATMGDLIELTARRQA